MRNIAIKDAMRHVFCWMIFLIFVVHSAAAIDFTIGDLTYTVEDAISHTVSVSAKDKYIEGDIIIPSEVEYEGVKYTVTTVQEHAFYELYNLTSVVIPNSVTSIGSLAFFKVKIVYYAGSERFGSPWGAKRLIKGTVIDGDFVYEDNEKTKLVAYIGSESEIVIPGSVTSIEGNAFKECSELTSITIPNSVTTIGNEAFCYCTSLTSVNIPNSVTSIGSEAFYYCTSLTTVTIPNSVITIESGTFQKCSNLTSVVLPNSVTTIGFVAFSGCGNLKSITIPSSVTTIKGYAFSYCTGMTSIVIPNSVTEIDEKAFLYIDTLYYGGTATKYSPWGADFLIKGIVFDGDFVFKDEQKEELVGYIGTSGIVNIPNGVKIIGDNTFKNHSELTTISIPNTVHSIGENAFYGCSKLTAFTIPASVTSIGKYAFYDCSGLTSITIPNSVTTIGSRAFGGCTGLTSVTISDAITTIEDGTFHDCTGLTSVTIPNSVTTIGSYAFQYCTGLTSVTIPNSVTTIGSYAFSNCNALKSITIPSTVSTIGKDAFYKIGTVYYDGNATGSPWSAYRHIKENFVYGNFAYANERKDSLLAYICADTRVTIPASVVYIGNYVFYGCENISSVCIPNSVTEIGSVAFYNVDTVFFGGNLYGSPWGAKTQIKGNVIDGNFVYLDEEKTNLSAYLGTDSVVNIPNQVKIIGRYVFENNKKITSVTIPNSVTTIGYSAFSGCTGLKSVTIPNSVTTIEEFAFSDCTGLTSVTIPNSVTTIGYSAFSGCTGVNSVTIPNSVTTIGSKAFYNVGAIIYEGDATGSPWGAKCHMKEDYIDGDFVYADEQKTKLISYIGSDTAVVIPNQVISIGEKAFYDKTGVKSVTIPNSVTTIGSDAFYNVGAILYEGDATGSPWGAKYHITEGYVDGDFVYADEQKTELISYIGSDAAVVIPNQVKSIGEKAFYNKTGVKSVSIPNSVTSINYSAFSGCTGLTSVTIPNSVTYIGHSAFSGCTGLKSVTIPNSVTAIANYAFYGCSGLTSVTIPNSVTSIGSYEFSGCTSLKSVTIPSSVTSIGNYAFYGCSGLTSVTIPNSVTSIGSYEFSGCTSLKSVTIPSSVTSIGNSAFSGADTIYYAGTATGSPWGAKRHIRGAYSDGDFVYADEQKTRLTDYVGSATAVVIPEQVESIEPMTFSNNTKLTMVTIPSSVTSIGYSAFSGCTGLTAVTIPNTITTIEFGTFSGCTGLTSVTIPNSVTSIDYSVFSGCTGLTSVTLPDSLVFIGREAFSGCANLKDISLPNTVSSIGTRAFQRCTSLDTIVLPNSLTYIDQLVFYECSALSSVTIPNSVTSIDWVAFQGCSMKSVSVPNSVTSIDGGAFYGTDTIYYGGPASGANWGAKHRGKIPDGDFIYADKEKESVIGYIGSNSEVVIPKQVKYIADSAFYNHGELTAVFLHDSVKCINKSAFEGCTGLRSIHIPNSVVTVGKSAFRGIDTVCYLVESDTIRIIKDTLFIHDVKEFNFYRALTPKSVIPNGKLETDLDLSSICGIIDGETASWESIVLTGASFDGGNHSISNLYINQPNGKAALFTGYDILISNLKLKNAYIKGGYAYGFMYGDGVYYNCHFDGVLTGDWCAVFTGKGATAVNCSNYGMVIANKYAYFMDGQYAYNCYNRGSVLSLEGSAVTYFTSATNCYNAGEVMGAKGSKAFGYDLIHCFNLKIDNYSDGACQLDSLAFLSGAVTDSLNEYVLQNPKIKNYYLLDSVPLFSWVQGEDGFPRFEDVDLKPTQGYVVHFTGVVDDVHITKTGTIDLPVCPIDGHTYIFSNNFDGKNIVSDTTITVGIIENLDFLERDKDGFYLIHNGRELALFRDVVNDGAAIINARLTNDIDLDEECKDSVWTPIGIYSYKGSKLAFEGVFDGAGYSIEHLYDISDSPYEGVATHWYRGLFGYAKNALIQNVVVKNSRITGFCVAAIVAVSDNTTIANCGSEAELYGYSDYGAASMCAYSCGQDSHLSVLNCYNLGEVKGEYQAYAIASYSRNELSEFKNCYSSANIFWDYRSSDGEQGQFCADGKCTRCFTDSVLCNQKEIEGVTKTSTERIKSDAFLADMNAWVDSMNAVQSKIVFAHWVRDKVDEYPKLRPVSSSSVLSDKPSIATDGISVYAVDGTIYIRSAHAGKTNLYDIHGKAVASVVYTEGVTTVDGLQKGVYILCGVKMMIR